MQLDGILSMPEYIQIVLATGYVGYSVANAGYRDKERKDQLFYGVMVYGLIGYFVFSRLQAQYNVFLASLVFAFLFTVLCALIWRRYLWPVFYHRLRCGGVFNEDFIPNIWSGVIHNMDVVPTQISVYLKSGTILSCYEVQSFANAPIPMYYSDNEGNIAMYVTERTNPDGSEYVPDDVRVIGWGDNLTFIPAREIERVNIRLLPKK